MRKSMEMFTNGERTEMKPRDRAKMKNEKVDVDKSLYICSIEYKVNILPRYVIHAIKLSDILSCSCEVKFYAPDHKIFGSSSVQIQCQSCSSSSSKSESNSSLRKVASRIGRDLPCFPGCGVFGSQILFAGGMIPTPHHIVFRQRDGQRFSKSVYVFETDSSVDPNPKIKPQTSFGFQEPKPEPLVVEVDGALYALAGRPQYDKRVMTFEVFCPATQKWLSMPTLVLPPGCCLARYTAISTCFSYAIVGTKIMVSSLFDTKAPRFCFDVANPRQGWMLLPSIGSAPAEFPTFRGRALVLDLEDDDDKLMFIYDLDQEGEASAVIIYYISNGSSPKRIYVLRPLPIEFCSSRRHYSFVHLGGPYVCLAVSHYMDREKYHGEAKFEKMRLLLATFQFDFHRPTTSVHAKFQSHRLFEYNWPEERTSGVSLLGCFVL